MHGLAVHEATALRAGLPALTAHAMAALPPRNPVRGAVHGEAPALANIIGLQIVVIIQMPHLPLPRDTGRHHRLPSAASARYSRPWPIPPASPPAPAPHRVATRPLLPASRRASPGRRGCCRSATGGRSG